MIIIVRQYSTCFTVFGISLIIATVLIVKFQNYGTLLQLQSPGIELFHNTHSLSLTNSVDPPCFRTRNIYVCSGYCPWANTNHDELVSCSLLPRILHPDFVKYGVYCVPDADQCPTYNAWLKDRLPQQRQHVKQIPDHLLSNFTLNYSVQVNNSFQDFRTDDTWPANWTVDFIEKYRRQVRAREAFGSYQNKDIYAALDKYSSLAIVNKKCAVIGTENPWIEAALLEYNASSVTTIEYATIYSNVPRLHTITPMEFARKQENKRNTREFFDSVWSYSSIEHDGLGRYRDPLNPYGDLQTMVKISCILKPGGFLFLAVPLNIKDYLQFNVHRIYGPIRLPLLYRNYHIVEVLGLEMAREIFVYNIQPFVVLQNKLGCR